MTKSSKDAPLNDVVDNIFSISESLGEVEFFVDNDGTVESKQLTNDNDDFTLLLFSSRDCGSCKEEHRDIAARLKNLENNKQEGLSVLSFLVELNPAVPDQKNQILEWREKQNVSWPFAADPSSNISKSFCTENRYPCVVLVDPSGDIVLRNIGKVKASTLESLLGFKIGEEPEPPTEFGNNPFFGKYFNETRLFGQKQPTGEVVFEERNFGNDLERPLLVIFSAFLCATCEKEHEELIEVYHSANPILKQIDIVTAVLPYDVNTETGQKRIEDEWINKLHIPWPVTGLPGLEVGKFFENYCKDGNPDNQGVAPCTALFVPGKGIVMQRYEVPVKTILKEIKTHLKPVHFEEKFEALLNVPTSADELSFSQVGYNSQSGKPIVAVFGAKFCSDCIKEHKELVELYNSGDSYLKDVELVSMIIGYDTEDEQQAKEFAKDWKIDLQIPWPVTAIKGRDAGKFLKKYCWDPVPDNQEQAPCTSIFTPKHGKVFERFNMHVEDIEKVLKGEEVPPYIDDGGDVGVFTEEDDVQVPLASDQDSDEN